jgi:uncharacterized membrane protein
MAMEFSGSLIGWLVVTCFLCRFFFFFSMTSMQYGHSFSCMIYTLYGNTYPQGIASLLRAISVILIAVLLFSSHGFHYSKKKEITNRSFHLSVSPISMKPSPDYYYAHY